MNADLMELAELRERATSYDDVARIDRMMDAIHEEVAAK